MRVYKDGAGQRHYLDECQRLLDAMKSLVGVDADAYKDVKRRLREKLNELR